MSEVTALPAPTLVASQAPLTILATPAARFGRRRFGVGFWLGVTWLSAVVVVALTVDWLPLKDPAASDYLHIQKGPSLAHWLGTDNLGRDILSRVAHGARVSLIVGFGAVGIALAVGGFFGVLAGYYRRWMESVVNFVVNVTLAFPPLVLALALVAFSGPSLRNVTLAIGILAIPAFIRVSRASSLVYSQREFVLAARGLGARGRRVVWREVLPNVVPPVVTFALLVVGVAILAEGGLSFLGLGVPPPRPTWGGMVNEGRRYIETAPHICLIPASTMFFTVLSLNFVGDKLRGLFEVRESAL